MAKNHVQPGKIITVILAATYAAGDLIKVGDFAGVCLKGGISGDTVEVMVEEVFVVPKLTADVMPQGTSVYLDAANKRVTLTTSGNTYAGRTTVAADGTATTVALKLNA